MRKTGKTVPFRNIEDIKKSIKYLETNCDPTYLLIFKVALFSGLRISDVLSLRYDQNIDDNHIVIVESKKKLLREYRAHLKALNKAKEFAVNLCETRQELAKLTMARAQDLYKHLPDEAKEFYQTELKHNIAALKHTKRHCKLPPVIIDELQKRQRKFKKIDDGFIFATATLKTHMGSRNGKTIGRVAVWKQFSKIGEALNFNFNTSCHGLRKSFATLLYQTTNDSQLVIKTVQWTDDKLLQTYLDITEDKPDQAVDSMQDILLAGVA